MIRAALALAAAVVILVPDPAHADAQLLSEPAVSYPLTNPDGTLATRVRVDAPRLSWRTRAVAHWWDTALPGLVVETGPCLPEIACVRVHVGSYGDTDWSGLTAFPEPGVREILLNRDTTGRFSGQRRRVASHEIGHALGLGHHAVVDGLLCASPAPCDERAWVWQPLDAELAPLRAYFAGGEP